MNLNTFFDKLTNFKILFTADPSPIQVSNKELVFVISNYLYEFKEVKLNVELNRVEIILE